MQIRVLGPVDALRDGAPVALGGPRPRTVVAALALSGEAVSVGRLVDEVWPGDPPRSAVATLQSYLSRLRRELGAGCLVNGGRSYRLDVGTGTLDLDRFQDDVAAARSAVAAGDLEVAAASYAAALATWRGRVAADIDGGAILREARARLDELRLVAIEERIDVALATGRHREAIPDLDALTCTHPHRERFHGQRMLALYRAGRQADALAGYQTARDHLIDGIGVEPGPELQELQQRILAQDPSLDLPAPPIVAGAPPLVPPTPPGAEPPSRQVPGGGGAPRRPDGPSPGTLPTPLDTFVGRSAERREIAGLLAGTRLVSLVGAGGCGKTQLALRVAQDIRDRFPAGVWWVELAALRDPENVERTVGAALGVPQPTQGTWRDAVIDRLAGGEQLVVLDNCEHLVDACAELVAAVLRHCASARVLTTSREPLDVAGERAWRVPSLTLPPPDASTQAVLASEAAQLLEVRAGAVRPGFELRGEDPRVVAQVCRELDGIPLALELAAARLAVLSVEELADRLTDRFRVLTGGRRSAPARHRTLEAAIGWSYDLLVEDERVLLDRLSIFAGGFTIDDVEAVCTGPPLRSSDVLDLLAALVDKSLVQRVGSAGGPARHDLLAAVRSFAEARLGDEELTVLRRRHAEHYVGIAEAARPNLTGFAQVRWLNRLHAEQDNLRQVLRFGGEPAARVAGSAWMFWLEFGHAHEGDGWVRQVLRAPGTDDDPRLLLYLEEGAARLAAAIGEPDRVAQHLGSAEEHARRLGDRSALVRFAALRASEMAHRGDLAAATDVIEAAGGLVDADVEPWTLASLEQHRADVAARLGDLARAGAAYAAAEEGFVEVGDEWGACLARLGAARIARRRGELALAARHHRTNLERGLDLTVSTLDFVGLPQDLQGLALLASDSGQHELAALLLGTATTLRLAVELTEAADDQEGRRLAWDRAVEAIGEDTAHAAFEAGRTGTAEDAVLLALERTAHLATSGS